MLKYFKINHINKNFHIENNSIFWTLNDSQGPSCIYALKIDGTLIMTICLEGAENFDWEAIATAPCSEL